MPKQGWWIVALAAVAAGVTLGLMRGRRTAPPPQPVAAVPAPPAPPALPPPPERVRHYAVVCSSFSGDPQHADWFWGSSSWIYRVLREKYGYPDEAIYYLHEDPEDAARRNAREQDPARRVTVDGKTTVENIGAICRHLSEIVEEGDHVLFYMIGHTGFQGGHSRYATIGEPLADIDLEEMADRIRTRNIAAVFSPCQTEGFLWTLGKPGRVVIVSTRATEFNAAGVAEAGIRGFEDPSCDLDGDGRLSFFEAYQSILKEQQGWYQAKGMVQREHALLDDDGDGEGHYLPDEPDTEGALARKTFLGDEGRRLQVSPAAIAWLKERQKGLALGE